MSAEDPMEAPIEMPHEVHSEGPTAPKASDSSVPQSSVGPKCSDNSIPMSSSSTPKSLVLSSSSSKSIT